MTSHLVSSSGVSVQRRSRLKAMKTPPWTSPTLSFRIAAKEPGIITEFFISGVNQDASPKMMSGLAESIRVLISAFLFLIRPAIHDPYSQSIVKSRLLVFDLASLDGCTMGEEAAGAIWSGIWCQSIFI